MKPKEANGNKWQRAAEETLKAIESKERGRTSIYDAYKYGAKKK